MRTQAAKAAAFTESVIRGMTQLCNQHGGVNLAQGFPDFPAPQAVKDAVRSVSLNGRIRRPMITVNGSLETLLPPAVDSDVYDALVDEAGSGRLHRY